MAMMMNLNDKSFDYFNALTDVARMVVVQMERGVSADDTLDILLQLGDDASRRFNKMLEDLQQQYNSARGEEKVDPNSPIR
jgi:hypothetical protein